MGGDDMLDQMCSYYWTTIKTKRWQIRIFTHFLMAAAVNAHILYKLGGGEKMKEGGLVRGDEGFDLLSYISMLVDQLCTALSAKVLKDPEHPFRYIGCHHPFCYQNFRDKNTANRVTTGEIV
jgi:hypothetical protein